MLQLIRQYHTWRYNLYSYTTHHATITSHLLPLESNMEHRAEVIPIHDCLYLANSCSSCIFLTRIVELSLWSVYLSLTPWWPLENLKWNLDFSHPKRMANVVSSPSQCTTSSRSSFYHHLFFIYFLRFLCTLKREMKKKKSIVYFLVTWKSRGPNDA